DDKHPDSLVAGHINDLCARAVAKGIDVFKVIQAACINPVVHYKLEVGLLRKGDHADFIVAEDLVHFKINTTYINGQLVAENGRSNIKTKQATAINHFNCEIKKPADFIVRDKGEETVNVIEALDGQLITNRIQVSSSILKTENGLLESNTQEDILKIVVFNRYKPAPISIGWIRNFGFRSGAIASTVAHDSHNIIAVGVDDESICSAVNLVIKEKGGVSCVDLTPTLSLQGEGLKKSLVLGLPVAGLMSTDDGYKVADTYTATDAMAKSLGSGLSAPFMTLSFMALLVIPHIKLSDKGLFNGDEFRFYN
ncbi:MAG TPA: adenine deaminase C-terminal domain-containing protein, partial [Segetibacter sp.]